MSTTKIFPIALVALICYPLGGASANSASIVGLGLTPCKHFSEAKDGPTAPVFLIWAQGFMSALNMARADQGKRTKNLGGQPKYSPENQVAILARYCGQNPERSFVSATIDLYSKLPEQ